MNITKGEFDRSVLKLTTHGFIQKTHNDGWYKIMIPDESYVRSTKKRKHMGWKISKQKRFRVYEKDGWECVYCSSTYQPDLSLDHLIPVSLGGTNAELNLVTACRPCNSKKRTKLDVKPIFGRFRDIELA